MSAVPEGARCGRHPESEAAALCARCGDFLCTGCAIAIEGASYCASCEPLAGEPFPWERRGELGIARAMAATTLGTLLRTRATFAPGFRDRSVLPSIVYAIALSAPVAWIQAAVELAWPSDRRELFASDRLEPLRWLSSDAAQIARAVGSPLVTLAYVGIFSVAWIAGLRLSGAPRTASSHVVRAVAYVAGATAPLSLAALLPDVLGGPLALVLGVFAIVLQGRALRAITRASGWRIFAAGLVMTLAITLFLCALSGAIAMATSP